MIHLSFLHSYTNFSWKSAWRGITTDPRVTGKVLEQSKIGLGCKSLWRWREAVALQAGPLADLPYLAAAHSLAKIWCPHSTRSTKEILFSCHTTNRLVLKYALTVVDVPSHYQEAESLTSKYSDEVAEAFQSIHKRSPLTCLSAATGRPRARIHGRCYQTHGKPQNIFSTQAR